MHLCRPAQVVVTLQTSKLYFACQLWAAFEKSRVPQLLILAVSGTWSRHLRSSRSAAASMLIWRSAKMLASFSLTSFLPIWFARGNLHGPSEPKRADLTNLLPSPPCQATRTMPMHSGALASPCHRGPPPFPSGLPRNALAVSLAGLLSVSLGSVLGPLHC